VVRKTCVLLQVLWTLLALQDRNRAAKKPRLKDVKVGTAEDDRETVSEKDIQAPGLLIRPRHTIRHCQILDLGKELSDNPDYDNLAPD
jgi:hypothetical protein